jgi:hypothetical protein
MESRYELSATVQDYRIREAMITPDVAQEHTCYVGSLYLIAGDHVSVLRQAVYYNHDVLASFGFWQVNDEVDRDVCPTSFGYG